MSEMTCCPLSTGDGEAWEYHAESIVKAAKDYACTECCETIAKGAKHEFVKGMYDGMWSAYRTCLSCVEIRNHFGCSGWIYEHLWEDLEENFFPDMKAGGPCMEGLSPAAKQRLIDARMEWYMAQGEIDDSKWEGWKAPEATT